MMQVGRYVDELHTQKIIAPLGKFDVNQKYMINSDLFDRMDDDDISGDFENITTQLEGREITFVRQDDVPEEQPFTYKMALRNFSIY